MMLPNQRDSLTETEASAKTAELNRSALSGDTQKKYFRSWKVGFYRNILRESCEITFEKPAPSL